MVGLGEAMVDAMRPYSSLKALTPDRVYFNPLPEFLAVYGSCATNSDSSKSLRTDTGVY
jgi:hypothetical protein